MKADPGVIFLVSITVICFSGYLLLNWDGFRGILYGNMDQGRHTGEERRLVE